MPQDFDSPLLKEIRDQFDYYSREWDDTYEEGRIDMRYVAGDPWKPKDRKAREGAGRICFSSDEINQYTNDLINNVRRNPRGVKVVPNGYGATDVTATMRGDKIREIEYKSKAQAAIRIAFEGAVQRSFGFYKFKTQYVKDSVDEQELVYVAIPNPETVLIDPEYKEADCSDIDGAFEFESISRAKFKSRWPEAEVTSFNPDLGRLAPAWHKEDSVQVASYWKRERTKDWIIRLQNGNTTRLSKFPEGSKKGANFIELPNGETVLFQKARPDDRFTVKQYVTNGLEVMETNTWVGNQIPIIAVLGKEIWVDEGNEGGGTKRKLLSLVRLARDPFMAYCYIRTCELEIVQQAPKALWAGFEGQFNTTTEWESLNKQLFPYVEFKLTTEESRSSGGDPKLPPPQRIIFDAAGIQTLEISAEAMRRAIQSAMGITGLLNGTQQNSEAMSGKALQTLDSQENNTNFHFIDNLDLAIENGGRQLNHNLGPVYDNPRTTGFRKATGEHYSSPVNQLGPDGTTPAGFHFSVGEHEVQITKGPSELNQRAEAQDFGETLIKEMPETAARILDLIIKQRNLGPLGDEMAKRLAPPDPANQIPPAVQAQLQKMQAVIQKLMFERQAKTVEQQGKAWLATREQQVELQKKRMDLEGQILQAMIKQGQQTNAQALEAQLEQWITIFEQMHEFQGQQSAQAHERQLSAQEHQQTLEQGQQAAALSPPPAPGAQPGTPAQG